MADEEEEDDDDWLAAVVRRRASGPEPHGVGSAGSPGGSAGGSAGRSPGFSRCAHSASEPGRSPERWRTQTKGAALRSSGNAASVRELRDTDDYRKWRRDCRPPSCELLPPGADAATRGLCRASVMSVSKGRPCCRFLDDTLLAPLSRGTIDGHRPSRPRRSTDLSSSMP